MNISWIILALTTSLLTLLYLMLTRRVILGRRKFKLPYMVNDDRKFIATFRAHANFNEYVPLTLILMGLAIILQIHPLALILLSALFVAGRYVHAYSLIHLESEGRYSGRIFGMLSTLSVITLLALYNLVICISHIWQLYN